MRKHGAEMGRRSEHGAAMFVLCAREAVWFLMSGGRLRGHGFGGKQAEVDLVAVASGGRGRTQRLNGPPSRLMRAASGFFFCYTVLA